MPIQTAQGRSVEIIKPPRFDRGMIHVQVAVNGRKLPSVSTLAEVFDQTANELNEGEFWDWIAFSAESAMPALEQQLREGRIDRIEL